MGKLKITETVLRDAHQSLIATRMSMADMEPMLKPLDEVGFYSCEVWGGATFDACIRFLDEDPWERLRIIRIFDALKMCIRDRSASCASTRRRRRRPRRPRPKIRTAPESEHTRTLLACI